MASCHSIDDAQGEKESIAYFKADFPAIDIKDTSSIKGRHVLVRDAVAAYLVFQVEPAEAAAILRMGFSPSSGKEFADVSGGGNRPPWWLPPAEGMECYKCDPWRKDMSYSVAVVGYDKAQGRMYFMHSAFD